MEFITHDFDGEARGAIAFVIRGVCVVIGKVKVRSNTCPGFQGGVEAAG